MTRVRVDSPVPEDKVRRLEEWLIWIGGVYAPSLEQTAMIDACFNIPTCLCLLYTVVRT